MSINELKAHLLSARNLALAEKEKKDLVVVCPACLTTLNKTNHYMSENPKLKRTIGAALETANMQYFGTVKVRHLLEVIVNDVGESEIKARVKRSLSGLKVAPYYGCQLTRPFGDIDDKEFPVLLDRLLTWLGVEPVNFPMKAKCCGGMLAMTSEKVGLNLARGLIQNALDNGAEIIGTICPLCHMTLEAYQGNVNKLFGTKYSVPILYFTQLVGLALGFSREALGINEELIPSQPALEKHLEVLR
jgi:heterodisulfide reductase subunit B